MCAPTVTAGDAERPIKDVQLFYIVIGNIIDFFARGYKVPGKPMILLESLIVIFHKVGKLNQGEVSVAEVSQDSLFHLFEFIRTVALIDHECSFCWLSSFGKERGRHRISVSGPIRLINKHPAATSHQDDFVSSAAAAAEVRAAEIPEVSSTVAADILEVPFVSSAGVPDVSPAVAIEMHEISSTGAADTINEAV